MRIPIIFLFTGLSGAGKTTLSRAVAERLRQKRIPVVIFDGDELRSSAHKGLGFTPEDRRENIRRAGAIAKLVAEQDVVVFLALIAPIAADRENLKKEIGDNLVIIHVDCSISECIRRDPKGNYKRALNGRLSGYTGIEGTYEPPDNPDLHLDTTSNDIKKSIEKCLEFILSRLGKALA